MIVQFGSGRTNHKWTISVKDAMTGNYFGIHCKRCKLYFESEDYSYYVINNIMSPYILRSMDWLDSKYECLNENEKDIKEIIC